MKGLVLARRRVSTDLCRATRTDGFPRLARPPSGGGAGDEASKAGERIRTVDIHVGNVTLYH